MRMGEGGGGAGGGQGSSRPAFKSPYFVRARKFVVCNLVHKNFELKNWLRISWGGGGGV